VVSGGINRVVGQIRQVAAETAFGGLTDADLLARYAGGREEAAFDVIVRRHGPLVLAVCRRILDDSHAADDAFQATFLVLARRARSIRKSRSLASWLHGVARRIAARARASGRTRRWYERRWRRTPPSDALHEVVWRDVGAILDEEIQKLPERVRVPFVLCYLQGVTNDAAARTLSCPTGTVLSRLSKARELLRARLTRRGLVLSAGFLATAPSDAAIRVPAALAEAAFAAAAAGSQASVTPAVAALAAGVAWPRWLVGRMAAASGLAVAVACAAIGPIYLGQATREMPTPVPAAAAESPKTDLERLQGVWAVTASEFEGASDLPATMRGAKATFAGDRLTLIGPINRLQLLSVALDPTANPKTIDTTPIDGPAKGITSRGIYRLDGDTLQFCMPAMVSGMVIRYGPRTPREAPNEKALTAPAVRPDAFTAPRGSFRRLFTLKRVVPDP
jgi:RNA polymerase sigma factor (sigma-70 family)